MLAPVVADSTLAFKLASLYPTWSHSVMKRTLILGPFCLTLLLRFVIFLLVIWTGVHYYLLPVVRGASYYVSAPPTLAVLQTVDAILQLTSCSFASVLMLQRALGVSWRANRHGSNSSPDEAAPWRHLRFFFESVFMSFLPPVFCQLIIVITIFLMTEAAGIAYTYGITLNVVFSLWFSILATSWSTIRNRSSIGARTTSGRVLSSHHSSMDRLRPGSRSILGTFLDRAGMSQQDDDDDDAPAAEEEMEVVRTLPSATQTMLKDESKGVNGAALPHRGTSQWRRSLTAPRQTLHRSMDDDSA